MIQTLREVESDFGSSTFVLKAAGPSGELLGSVRARRDGEGVCLFRLSVDPAFQGRGAARALMDAAEKALPSRRYWMKTRSGNEPAATLYLKLGYTAYEEEDADPSLRFSFFEKLVPPRTPARARGRARHPTSG
jgi:ribosomal protein S18 acetylase RimI-like enzyme